MFDFCYTDVPCQEEQEIQPGEIGIGQSLHCPEKGRSRLKNNIHIRNDWMEDSGFDPRDYAHLFYIKDLYELPLEEMGPTITIMDPMLSGQEIVVRNPYHFGAERIGSFRQFLMSHFYQGYQLFLSHLVESGQLPIGKESSAIPVPEHIYTENPCVKRINFYRKSMEEVYVDLIMSIDITLMAQGESDHLSQWYRIRTYSVLTPGFEDFNNLVSIMIYDRNEPAPGKPLDDYLVPVTSARLLDSESTELLALYYPEALDKPCRINGQELASRMGLNLQFYHLSEANTVRGEMFFEEREITVLNKNGEWVGVTIPPDTILIDTATCEDENHFLNQETLNDAIIHECFHAYGHRLFYLGQRLYNEELVCLSCAVTGIREVQEIDRELVSGRQKDRSPIDWIEWQANRATPRVRMPARTTQMKIDELFAKVDRLYPNMARPKRIANVITELARFYGVSKQSAKLRMIELGYSEAQGVLNYVNGGYVENHAFAPNSLGRDQTFTISFEDALSLYAGDRAFRQVIDGGRFLYVDGHYCLNSGKYLYRRNGSLFLTSYAKAHMDECCLIFTLRWGGVKYSYREGRLQKQIVDRRPVPAFDESQPAFDYLAEAKRLSQILLDLPASPCATLKAHMERKGITIEKLIAKSGVSDRTISRLRRDIDYKPSLGNALAICFGLQLEPELSIDWLRKMGITLTNSPQDILYSMILHSQYTSSIASINEILIKNGLQPLSRMEEELES